MPDTKTLSPFQLMVANHRKQSPTRTTRYAIIAGSSVVALSDVQVIDAPSRMTSHDLEALIDSGTFEDTGTVATLPVRRLTSKR